MEEGGRTRRRTINKISKKEEKQKKEKKEGKKEKGEEQTKTNKEKEKEEGVAPLLKPRDLRLRGKEKRSTNHKTPAPTQQHPRKQLNHSEH